VQVGANNGLTFDPPSVNASVGDTVSFLFMAKNHTATQSSFAAPCQPLAGGVDSGFQPVAAGATSVPSLTITVNATTPLWFSCMQTGHCEQGMVFAVNANANKSFDAFQATAKASAPDGTPPASSSAPGSSPSSGSSSGAPPASSSGASPSGASSSGSSPSPSASPANGAASVGVRAGALL
ncbi:Cupredoxin, partial [Gloeopeniophorella convolvens]